MFTMAINNYVNWRVMTTINCTCLASSQEPSPKQGDNASGWNRNQSGSSRSPTAQVLWKHCFCNVVLGFSLTRCQLIWHTLFFSSQHGLDVCFYLRKSCPCVFLCLALRFPQSPTLDLSTFPSHFPCVIFHGVEFIQVLRVEFVPGFLSTPSWPRIFVFGFGRGSARFVGRFCTFIQFILQGLSWLVSRQLGRAIERGSHISGLC